MMLLLLDLLTIVFETNSGNSKVIFLLLGPGAGIGFYTSVFIYYRNTNKSHDFENETDVKVFNMKRKDHKQDEIRGTREAKVPGENTTKHRLRVYPLDH